MTLRYDVEHSINAVKENDIIINCIMRREYFDVSFFLEFHLMS